MPTKVGAFDVFGAIEQKWLQLGGVGGFLGAPLSNESPTFDGAGRAQTFKGGVVSWHPTIGAHEVHGAILARWLDAGREQFGHPITDESPCVGGKYNHFRALQFHQVPPPESSIYWSPETGPHDIFGAIRDKWASLGFERGPLGFPVLSARDQKGGSIQHFQRGVITWTPAGGPVDHVPGDTIQFDSGFRPVKCTRVLGAEQKRWIGCSKRWDFQFQHSRSPRGAGSIDYALAATLVTSAGSVFEFVHNGTVDGIGSDRKDDLTTTNQNPALATAFEDILTSGRLKATAAGKDNLVGAITDLVGEAAKELAAQGLKALVTVIVG